MFPIRALTILATLHVQRMSIDKELAALSRLFNKVKEEYDGGRGVDREESDRIAADAWLYGALAQAAGMSVASLVDDRVSIVRAILRGVRAGFVVYRADHRTSRRRRRRYAKRRSFLRTVLRDNWR